MTHKFKCSKVGEAEISIDFEFVLEEGEADSGLLKTVFSEYIVEPILQKTRNGESFISIGQCPLLRDALHYTIVEDFENNKIL